MDLDEPITSVQRKFVMHQHFNFDWYTISLTLNNNDRELCFGQQDPNDLDDDQNLFSNDGQLSMASAPNEKPPEEEEDAKPTEKPIDWSKLTLMSTNHQLREDQVVIGISSLRSHGQ